MSMFLRRKNKVEQRDNAGREFKEYHIGTVTPENVNRGKYTKNAFSGKFFVAYSLW